MKFKNQKENNSPLKLQSDVQLSRKKRRKELFTKSYGHDPTYNDFSEYDDDVLFDDDLKKEIPMTKLHNNMIFELVEKKATEKNTRSIFSNSD